MNFKNIFYPICKSLLLIFFFIGISYADVPTKANTTDEAQIPLLTQDVERFNHILQIIKYDYVQPTTAHTLLKNAMQGMASGLDPHSSYLDQDDLRDLQIATTGQFSGLGIEIGLDEGALRVVTPLDDGPAQKAGIKAGDLIVRIDKTPIQGLTLKEAVQKLRGEKGKSVELTIVREELNKPLFLKVVRGKVAVKSVKGRLLESNYGYVRIAGFQSSTRADLEQVIKEISAKNQGELKGLVIDLRNNPGGLLNSAAEVSNTFLDPKKMLFKQMIVYTKGQAPGSNMALYAKYNTFIYQQPLVVLINQGTASGAEIVAGALQDNKRAIIMGEKSFGKGSVQTIIPLDKNTALKLTTALYYTPAGRSIQASGITPDIMVHELKINTIAENPIDSIYLHEAELRGHLKNGNTVPLSVFEMPQTILPSSLALNDYQLFEALNLLKGIVLLKQSHPT